MGFFNKQKANSVPHSSRMHNPLSVVVQGDTFKPNNIKTPWREKSVQQMISLIYGGHTYYGQTTYKGRYAARLLNIRLI